MANHSWNTPVSLILKNTSAASGVEEDEPRQKSREDWRKAKELEKARKAGTAPAAVDEEGRNINPHIPHYISSAPWYIGASTPTLKHQRFQSKTQNKESNLDQCNNRGQSNKVSTKYREGAKYSNANIAPDEYVQPKVALDYDGNRDRWAGYDPSEHQSIIEEFCQVEEEKKRMKAEKLNSKKEQVEINFNKDEDKYVDEVGMPRTKVDSKQRITVKNLRIREDTAKYLRNFDLNSAHYDPKSRSMRDDPCAGTDKKDDYKGENSVRFSGDTAEHTNTQIFALDVSEKGINTHLLAEPTKIEILKTKYYQNKDKLRNEAQHRIIEKYSGKEHLDSPPQELLLGQTEKYKEYSSTGNIIKRQERSVIRSKYEEKLQPKSEERQKSAEESLDNESFSESLEAERIVTEKKPKQREIKRNKSYHIDEVAEAIERIERNLKTAEKWLQLDERKRPCNSMYSVKELTEKEIEASKIKRVREEDPMASL